MAKYTVAKDGFNHQGRNHTVGSEVELDEKTAAAHVGEGKLTPVKNGEDQK